MSDLERQIRDYAVLVDEAAGTVEIDSAETPATRDSRRTPVVPRVVLAFAFGAGVIVAVGLVALLNLFSGEEQPVIREPAPTTVTTPVPTTTAETAPPPTTQPQASPTPTIAWTRASDPDVFGSEAFVQVGAVTAVSDCTSEGVCSPIEGLVAVGYEAGEMGIRADGKVWRSTDGGTWTPVASDVFAGEGSQYIADVAYRAGRLVAVGEERSTDPGSGLSIQRIGHPGHYPAVWISDDSGVTWARVPRDDDAFQKFGGMTTVEATEDGFIATGGGFWFSPDGVDWIHTGEVNDALVLGLARGGPGWVAVGWEGGDRVEPWAPYVPLVWSSTDGREWILQRLEEGGSLNDLAASTQGLVGVGFHVESPLGVWRSADGVNWEVVPAELTGRLSSLPAGYWQNVSAIGRVGDWLLAVGTAGTRTERSEAAMWMSNDGGDSWIKLSLDPGKFGTISDFNQRSSLSHIEVINPDGAAPTVVLTGTYGRFGAIWYGTFEQTP